MLYSLLAISFVVGGFSAHDKTLFIIGGLFAVAGAITLHK